MTAAEGPVPAKLRLHRSVPVLARDTGVLQVGIDPRRRVTVAVTPARTVFLRTLSRGTTALPQAPDLRELVTRLQQRGLVLDEDAALARRRARAATPVRLLGPADWVAQLTSLLAAADVPVATADQAAEVTVHLGVGEPDREQVDTLTHVGDPVLFGGLVDARMRVGPFVLPGLTACLRCLDAHVSGVDPAHLTLPVGLVPEPRDDLPSTLLTSALVRLAGDVCAWAEGRRPSTWSATLWIDESLDVEREDWARHPHCGCSWGDSLADH